MPRRRFTLIEMLVVIAIIAILASLLAPSLHRSLRVANSLSCLNNLRQIGVWALGYATEWNGYLPIHGTATGTDTSVYNYAYDWVTVMKDEKLFNGKDLSTGAGMTCRELYAAHGARATTWTANSYGLNRYMGGPLSRLALRGAERRLYIGSDQLFRTVTRAFKLVCIRAECIGIYHFAPGLYIPPLYIFYYLRML